MTRREASSPDDITDQEWALIEPLLTKGKKHRGRKGLYTKREMMNAIFYLLRTGCSWRHLPHDFPPWKSVYTQFRRWRLSGLFNVLHEKLRKELRVLLKRAQDPTAGVVDSHSVKTTVKGGSKAMMALKRLKAENGISSLILKDYYYFV